MYGVDTLPSLPGTFVLLIKPNRLPNELELAPYGETWPGWGEYEYIYDAAGGLVV